MAETKHKKFAPKPGVRMGGGPPGAPGTMKMEKAKNFKGSFLRLAKYLLNYKISLIIVFSAAILSTVFSIYSPKVMSKAMTKLFDGFMAIIMGVPGASVDFDAIKDILIFLGVLYIVSAIFNYIQQLLMATITQKTVYNLRKQVDEKLTVLPLKYFDGNSTGDILSRVTNDIDNVGNSLQQSAVQLITSFATIIGVIIMMLTISPLLTLITMLSLPVIIFITMIIAKQSQKYFTDQWAVLGDLNGHVEEMFSGHKIIKAYGHEKEAIRFFEEKNNELYQLSWKAQFISGIIMPLMNSVNNLVYIAICVIGGYKVVNGTMSFGDVTAFVQYQRQLSQPLAQTANILNVLQSAIASAERVFELLDEPEEVSESLNPVKLDNIKGNVSFEHISFGYSEDKILIKDMTVTVKSGQMAAIVGPTGAGKTTLVNLLMRFYDTQEGKITIDGVPIKDMKREDLRSTFGMVLQDTWLFNGSIRDNIAYGKDNATEDEIKAAAKSAHVHRFVKTLSKGYDTIINEDGNNISQGQKQLLTIARAMLADPEILILDEATSNVDTRTEIRIQKAMNNLLKGRTSFVIAHRLSTIRDADIILVMNEGNIIEQGTHQELMDKGGFYTDLYNSQFSKPFEEEMA